MDVRIHFGNPAESGYPWLGVEWTWTTFEEGDMSRLTIIVFVVLIIGGSSCVCFGANGGKHV